MSMTTESRPHSEVSAVSSYDEGERHPLVPEASQEDLLLHEDDNSSYMKQVHFAPNVSEQTFSTVSIKKPSRRQIESKVLARQRQGAMDLMNRLYDRPANSQALVIVRQREALSQIKHSAPVPRPPSGNKNKIPAPAFRTTMFKRDFERQNKKKMEAEAENKMLPDHLLNSVRQRRPSRERLEPLPYTPRVDSARSCMGSNLSLRSFGSDGSMSPVDIFTGPEKKTVTFGGLSPAKPSTAAPSTQAMLLETSPAELPTPLPSTDGKRSATLHSSHSRMSSASQQKDPSLVLTYLKDNVYDDEEPEDERFVEVILEMRRKLGWVTELPRHGPGCKAKMETLKDKPDKEENDEGVNVVREDDGSFVYALARNRNDTRARYNPYDLQVVSAHVARSQALYYMGTASSVTRVEQVGDKELCSRKPVLWWLWERRLFNSIHNINVFVKFRLWKSFVCWRNNVRGQHTTSSHTILVKTLFSANEILQGCLLHVRSLCEAASGSLTGIGEGEAAIALVRLDKLKTVTLTEFLDVQHEQNKHALSQLNALREKVVHLVWESCATVAEMEGVTHGIREHSKKAVTIVDGRVTEEGDDDEDDDDKAKIKYKIKTKFGQIPIYEKKVKVSQKGRPTYAQIAEWRKILKRLSYFLRSVDYLVLELLRRLVITSTRTLLKFTTSSYQAGLMEEDDDKDAMSQRGDQDSDDDSDYEQETARRSMKQSIVSKSSLSVLSKGSIKQSTESIADGEDNELPQFDFDAPEVEIKPPDVDEVLEQISKQNEVIEIPEPIFSLQLVLNVPSSQKARRVSRTKKLSTSSSKSGHAGERRKSHVMFADQEQQDIAEEREEEEESGDSEYSEEEEEEEYTDDEHPDTKPPEKEKQAPNRFAYDEEGSEENRATEEAMHKSGKVYVSLSPTSATVKASFRGIIAGFENTIAEVVSMLREPKLAVFYSPPKHDLKLNYDEERLEEEEEYSPPWPDTHHLFSEDAHYQELIQSIMELITNVMDSVTDYSRNFDEYCTMVDKARKMDVDNSMSKKQWSTEEFLHVLRMHTDQVYQMQRMRRLKRLGLVRTESENFCQTCLPYPQSVLKSVCTKLPVISLKRNEDLLSIIKGACKRLDHLPESVEEFVDHLSFLGKMSSEMPALEKEYLIVTKLYTISKEFEVQIEPEELALYQTLSPSFQHLKTIILYAEAKKDDNIRKFSTDLDRLIESIRSRIIDIKNRVRDPVLLSGDTMASTALDKISILTEEVTEMTSKARNYGNYQERFGSSMSQTKRGFSEEFILSDKKDDNSAQEIQADLSEIERDLTLRRLLWESAEEWDKLEQEWTSSTFDTLNVESLQKNVNRFTQTVYMLEKGLPHNEVVPRLKEKVQDFKLVMPCITSLRNPSLKSRHWEQIARIIGKAIQTDEQFTLGNLIEMNIIKHKDAVQDISTTASNEATLERMLQKVMDLWQATDFRLVPHASGAVVIIAGADDILAMLEESQVTVGTIRGSRYVTPIKGQVEEWERRLALFSRTLDEWMTCQRNWLYLEQIFTTPDIQRQLPSESKLFGGVDKAWKDIMRRTEDRPNALRSATAPGVLEMLQSANSSLEKIQKCLEDYLETKRLVFPRFYFLSNDELLDILAQSKNPEAVQPHLGKCFGNIQMLEIKNIPRQPPTVKTITSAEGEILDMPKNVRARGPVEQWLCSVENGMFDTVKKHLKLGLQDWLGIKHEEWVVKHPGQVVLTVAQIMFNKNVLVCFMEPSPIKALVGFYEKMIESLNELAGLVSTNLVPHKRLSINALLTITVHNRDIVHSMLDNKIARRDDFEWTRQLRYEWDEQSNNCNVIQSNASFVYGYEYLGCSPRLVITPLTDRCNLTLTGALNLNLGGSPAGPAGTGKTETVKDLAKAMGKQCVVFNCSEGLDYKMLGKMFSGLSQSGSWCCFDEFNRIDVEVLSVVAQQIHTIKAAKDQSAPRFLFEGRDIKLNMQCGFFITMNPSYAGRVELPDNLKSLFRQVAMMVPDYALIAEIMLFSEGFTDAKSLSTKIVNLYQLASKQLSQQDHYDFGMRAIKSVLVMAGQRKRQLMIRRMKIHAVSGELHEISQEDESHILIHSLQDANMPKFLAEDVPLFESIMADLFPGVHLPKQDMGALEKAISMSIRDQGLQHWPNQIEKVKQLHSQILVRHGVMLVGPTGGGKTTARSILQRALVLLPTINVSEDLLGETRHRRQSMFTHNRHKKGHVEVFTLNPKCVKLGELYGETDPNTFEWSDGLIATATRKFAREHGSTDEGNRPTSSSTVVSTVASEHSEGAVLSSMDTIPTSWKWLVLDGPVDTIWVENLNTVLDDSKILCLANGERIALTQSMRLMFEVDDLSKASPATISRCAMVYMDPVDLGWRPYVKTWISRLPKEIPETGRRHLEALFEHTIEKGLNFVRQHSKFQMLPTPEMSMVMCLCNILAAFFEFMAKNGGFGTPDAPVRPGSADSETGSRSSSRTGSRQDKRGPKGKKQRNKDTDMQTLHEHRTTKSENKQYYLQRNPSQLCGMLGKLFVFAFTWSVGGNFKRVDDMDDDLGGGRTTAGGGKKQTQEISIDIASDFDNFVRELFEVEPPVGVRLPTSSKSVYSYFVDMDSGNFLAWDALIPSTTSLIERGAVITIGETMGVSGDEGQQSKASGDTDIVPTVDTVRYSFLAGLLLTNKHPVLLTGESGVGKTAIIKHMLKGLGKEGGTSYKSGTILGSVFNFTDKNQLLLDNISSLTRFGDDNDKLDLDLTMGGGAPKARPTPGLLSSLVQFSAQTSADRTQQALTTKLIKKGKDTLGAPKGKKVVVFVDDLNMPAAEEYGAQPPLELLRQFLDLGGFYDTKKLLWKDILDVTVMAACGPPGGGRNPVSPRLLKHFCMLALPQPSTRSLQHIYQVQLGRFFQENEFMPEVKECLFPMVSAAIAVYYRMCHAMRPTPAKIHYTFNIRDLSQVITGLLRADESVIVNSDNCAQLFAHEATRVFHDRLINHEDTSQFYEMLSDILHDYFKLWELVGKSRVKQVKWTGGELMSKPILFGDFMDLGEATVTRRIYKPISDRNRLLQVLEECYMQQNMGNTQAPQIVFFKEAVEHILRAARVFRQPGGHMLMVGLDGTGKSTTVSLASYIAECDLFKLTLTRGYNIADFREDLKKVCIMAGVKGKNIVFLLTDGDIVKEAFLEDVNCILNSGEVPDLFDNEEMDGIAMDLKAAAAEAQVPDTRIAVYQFFIQRVKKNLHIVLAMSPAGSKFRQRCRMNPSLINCCTIDWHKDWDQQAMLSVAQVYFQGVDFVAAAESGEQEDTKELKDAVAEMCVSIHDSIETACTQFWDEMRRHFYITPSSYMELIRVYSRMLKQQKSQFMDGRERLMVGLSRLSEAESLVGTMQEELVTLGPRIEEKAKDTEVLLEQLGKDQEAVDQVREIVEAEETVMKRETQVVQDYADECQRDLASVIPALQSAIHSLNTLDKTDISEVKVYARPPELVTMVMAAVCTLLLEKPDWATAKQVLGDAQFLKRLVNYDKNSTPEKIFHKLKKYSRHPDFKPEAVGKVSNACKSMCQWVLALEHYHEVYKMAKPKQKRVNEAKEALSLAQQKLAQKQASLAKIQEHLSNLQQQYQDSVNQRESLKEKKKLTAIRLDRASVLIAALSDEKVRWEEGVKNLDAMLQGVVGDTLVSAGAVAYLGAFNAKYRHQLISQWAAQCRDKQVPLSEKYEFVRSIVDANRILTWQNEGLPHDNHSTENAIIIKNARKWPLLIDPQGQAAKWIKEMEGFKLKIVQAADPNYLRTMERAIRVGEPVLLQEVTEDLDPSLKPILLQETFVRGGHHVIKLGDTEIEYNNNFRLYMTTSLGNPHFLPAVCIQVTVINFIVTFEGLQEQLLSSVVKQERPRLEHDRSQLLANIATDRQVLREMEDKSLSLLQKTEGHILDDQDLVETLQRSKVMSEEITTRIQQSELTEKQLNAARKKYLPVATRGAVLYFVLADLAGIDVMYQFSLTWFQNMFTAQISGVRDEGGELMTPRLSGTLRPGSASRTPLAGKDVVPTEEMTEQQLKEHMQRMIDRLTSSVYRVVSVALFAHHQLLFSFLLVSSIMRANATHEDEGDTDGQIQAQEWTVFLQGNVMASMMDETTLAEHDGLTPLQRLEADSSGIRPQRLRIITEVQWRHCQHLEATFPSVYDRLCRSIISCPAQWILLSQHADPYVLMSQPFDVDKHVTGPRAEEMMTFPWERLSPFQRLLLLHVVRPAALIASVRTFVHDRMGEKFVSSGTPDLKEMYEQSDAKTPLVFILSPGSDPGVALLRFAKELRGSALHLDMISLGRGQGPKAEELISKAQILKGRWIFLQNCHLAASWMPRLQTIVDNFNKPGADLDPQFRLWLSSKPDPCFPISILQTGLKMTVEPPIGVKNNLERTLASGMVSQRVYEETVPEKADVWKNLVMGLCFFNAVIHERKKYRRLGWNIPYEFNESDLEVSMMELEMLLRDQDHIPWPALWYLTGEVTFGGRVTDDWDRRCLHCLLKKFYNPRSLKPGYYYSEDKIYHPVDANTSYDDLRAYVEQLPTADTPQLFGMDHNAEKAFLESQASELVEGVLSVQPRLTLLAAAGGKTSDAMVLDMAADMMNTIPQAVQLDEDDSKPTQPNQIRITLTDIVKIGTGADFSMLKKKPKDGASKKDKTLEIDMTGVEELGRICQSALFTVLRQEIDRFNVLLSIIHRSLSSLTLAVKGEVVMSEALEEAYNAMLSQRVPAQWKASSWESVKPLGAWVKDLILRVDFFAEWADQVVQCAQKALKPPAVTTQQQQQQQDEQQQQQQQQLQEDSNTSINPRSFWLSAFFFPQGFLTAVLQNHARKMAVSVDSLVFDFAVLPNHGETEETLSDLKGKVNIKDLGFRGNAPPNEGVLVFGLFIDGARWDPEEQVLADSLPGQRFGRLPEIHFIPTSAASARPASSALESPMAMFHDEEEEAVSTTSSTTPRRYNYESPLYRTSTRAGTLSSTGHSTNFVTSVTVPCLQPLEVWVMRGVALLCQLDD